MLSATKTLKGPPKLYHGSLYSQQVDNSRVDSLSGITKVSTSLSSTIDVFQEAEILLSPLSASSPIRGYHWHGQINLSRNASSIKLKFNGMFIDKNSVRREVIKGNGKRWWNSRFRWTEHELIHRCYEKESITMKENQNKMCCWYSRLFFFFVQLHKIIHKK